jgi:hypothetical protein
MTLKYFFGETGVFIWDFLKFTEIVENLKYVKINEQHTNS